MTGYASDKAGAIVAVRGSAARAGSAAVHRRDWRARLPFFYGWVIVAGALLSLGLAYSVMYSFTVFYAALLDEFGWGRGEAAGVYSVFMIVSGVGAMAAGALSDRFGSGRVIAAGGMLLAIGLLACSRITSLWQFYAAYGVLVAFGVSVAGWTACVTMVRHWFSTRLGLALGIASGGIGVGIMVLVPLVQSLITGLGWRAAYTVLAGIVFCGLLPLGLIVMRGRPEDFGQQMDGGKAGTSSAAKRQVRRRRVEIVDEQWATRDWTVGTALKTHQCWLLVAVKLLGGIAAQMVFVHQVIYLTQNGYDKMLAASIVGLIGFLSVGGKILWGWSADTIGRELTYTLGCAAMIAAVALLALAPSAGTPAMLYLYAFVFALGYAVSAPLWPVVTADLFAGRSFGSIYGAINLLSGFGAALGAWLGGYVYDVTGSYAIAFGVAIFSKAASAGALWLVAPRKIRRVVHCRLNA